MTKFKIGDKVKAVQASHDWGRVKKGDIGVITHVDTDGSEYKVDFPNQKDWYATDSDLKIYVPKPTKNQRITALENEVAELSPLKQEVAELKLIVHELRGKKSVEPSTTNTVEDIIEFEGKQYRKVDREAHEGDVVISSSKTTCFVEKGKPYKVTRYGGFLTLNEGTPNIVNLYNGSRTPETVDVYELIKEGLNTQIPMLDETIKPLTPNQQRTEIIEKAKKFVEDTKLKQVNRNVLSGGNHLFNAYMTTTEFVINPEKRTVVALIRYVPQKYKGAVRGKGIAKCNPSDVFNEHIGKAIALGRALGLDVSEFEQAIQPTVAVGQLIEVCRASDNKSTGCFLTVNGINSNGYPTHDDGMCTSRYKIINDTNAQYGGAA